MKRYSPLYFLLALNIALAGSVAWLYQQNSVYKNRNRELIIQNDSVLSVNLKLMQAEALTKEKAARSKRKITAYRKN